jgi:hypothetical protein
MSVNPFAGLPPHLLAEVDAAEEAAEAARDALPEYLQHVAPAAPPVGSTTVQWLEPPATEGEGSPALVTEVSSLDDLAGVLWP